MKIGDVSVSLVFRGGFWGESVFAFLCLEFGDDGVALGFPCAPLREAFFAPEGAFVVAEVDVGVGFGDGVVGVVFPSFDDGADVVGVEVEFVGECCGVDVDEFWVHGVLVSVHGGKHPMDAVCRVLWCCLDGFEQE
jgi:hypothetical protein